MTETWYPLAVRDAGPAEKRGYAAFPSRTLLDIEGVVGHSMEGSLAAGLGELRRLARRASWPFSNPKVGPLLQHYPLESVCWTNGSIDSNFRFVGVEHEGVAGELINENQRQNLADLLAWLLTVLPGVHEWVRPGPSSAHRPTLWEHNEMTQFGSAPTACPSNRIPWAQVLALIEEDDMALSPEYQQKLQNFLDSMQDPALFTDPVTGEQGTKTNLQWLFDFVADQQEAGASFDYDKMAEALLKALGLRKE